MVEKGIRERKTIMDLRTLDVYYDPKKNYVSLKGIKRGLVHYGLVPRLQFMDQHHQHHLGAYHKGTVLGLT